MIYPRVTLTLTTAKCLAFLARFHMLRMTTLLGLYLEVAQQSADM